MRVQPLRRLCCHRQGAMALLVTIVTLLSQDFPGWSFVGGSGSRLSSSQRLQGVRRIPKHARVRAGSVAKEAPDVIALAKKYVSKGNGFWNPVDPELMAEDFVFRGEYIGPLSKKDYVDTISKLKVYEPFPDLQPNAFGFSIDPADALRVWFFVRQTGTHTAPWPLLSGVDALTIPPTSAKLKGPTEAYSMTFSPEGKVRHLTVGYVANKFEDNAGGAGAAFALFNIIGYGQLARLASLPIVRDFGNFLSNTVDARIPKTRSKEEDLPAWYSE